MARIWSVLAGTKSRQWKRFQDELLITIGYPSLDAGDLSKYEDLNELRIAVGALPRARKHKMLWAFAKEMQIGDLVVVPNDDGILGYGVIASDYRYVDHGVENTFCHRRGEFFG